MLVVLCTQFHVIPWKSIYMFAIKTLLSFSPHFDDARPRLKCRHFFVGWHCLSEFVCVCVLFFSLSMNGLSDLRLRRLTNSMANKNKRYEFNIINCMTSARCDMIQLKLNWIEVQVTRWAPLLMVRIQNTHQLIPPRSIQKCKSI